MKSFLSFFAPVLAVIAGVSLLAVGLTGVQAEAAPVKLRITQVYYNSPGADTGSNASVNAEYVQVTNLTGSTVNLKGYTVRDLANHVYTFGSYTVANGKTVRVHPGKAKNSTTNVYAGGTRYVWNNDKDTAILRDPRGATLSTCSYKAVGSSYYTMCPTATTSTVRPTPPTIAPTTPAATPTTEPATTTPPVIQTTAFRG